MIEGTNWAQAGDAAEAPRAVRVKGELLAELLCQDPATAPQTGVPCPGCWPGWQRPHNGLRGPHTVPLLQCPAAGLLSPSRL